MEPPKSWLTPIVNCGSDNVSLRHLRRKKAATMVWVPPDSAASRCNVHIQLEVVPERPFALSGKEKQLKWKRRPRPPMRLPVSLLKH